MHTSKFSKKNFKHFLKCLTRDFPYQGSLYHPFRDRARYVCPGEMMHTVAVLPLPLGTWREARYLYFSDFLQGFLIHANLVEFF